MEEKDQTIGFRVTLKERQKLEEEAKQTGLSLTDHVRMKLLSVPTEASTDHLEALIKHAIYTINQVYVGVFAIAEAEGKARRFLSAREIDQVHDQVRAEALVYAVQFPNSFAAVQAEIAALAKNGAK
jgi:hypothetical protein